MDTHLSVLAMASNLFVFVARSCCKACVCSGQSQNPTASLRAPNDSSPKIAPRPCTEDPRPFFRVIFGFQLWGRLLDLRPTTAKLRDVFSRVRHSSPFSMGHSFPRQVHVQGPRIWPLASISLTSRPSQWRTQRGRTSGCHHRL